VLKGELEESLALDGSNGQHLTNDLLTTVRECTVSFEPAENEDYLFAKAEEIQRQAAQNGRKLSYLLTLPLPFLRSLNAERAREAARELRLIADVNLEICDGGTRIRQMGETIRDSVAVLASTLLLRE
jgi:hypothetical protein